MEHLFSPNNNNGKQQLQPDSPPRREATIDDLPDELLGLIFRQLPPWLHRVRVEGVSKRFQRVALAHGWADVREFSTEHFRNGLYHKPAWWGLLLSRVGPHLTTLELGERFANYNSAENLRVELEKCPRVKHLSVCWEQLDPPTAPEHIASAYATTLKSLRVYSYHWAGCSVKAVRGLSEALGKLTALEYLDLWECEEEAFTPEFYFTASSLPNLRHLTLHTKEGSRILSEGNIEMLAALGHLRSFRLLQSEPLPELSFLQRFTHLEHLDVFELTEENTESFVKTLLPLGDTLKALVFTKTMDSASTTSITLLERLIATVVEHLPMLEHLTLNVWFDPGMDWEEVRPRLQECVFNPLGFWSRLQNLRSLDLLVNLEPLSWAWLERMSQRLEYLELREKPSLSTLCNIVRNSKNLRGLDLGKWGTQLSAADRKLLVEASLQTTPNVCMIDGKRVLALPILRIGYNPYNPAYLNQEERELERENSTTASRVRFGHSYHMCSHVLDFYQYGCLSEGRPSFTQR